jgi:tetratricopeptide (TPR) repeat protein
MRQKDLLIKSVLLGLLFVVFCGLPFHGLAGDRASSVAAKVTAPQEVISEEQRAMTSDDQFLEANRAYEAGDLAKAIGIYESLVAHAGISASLCYNLANSYARNGEPGKAVLGYERALLLAPGAADIRANLQLLRRDKGLLQEEVSVLQRPATLLGLNQWAALAAFFLLFLALLPLVALRVPVVSRLSLPLTIACLLLLAACIAGVVIQYQNWQQAVIISPESRLLISPFDGAGVTDVIEEGSLIRIIKVHGNYALIHDEKGRSGWIPGSSFEYIATTVADKN